MGKETLKLNTNTVLEVIENELECIKRANKCDRHCEDCPLVMDDKLLIEVYEWLITSLKVARELEEQEKYREDIMAMNDKWLILEKLNIREGKFSKIDKSK